VHHEHGASRQSDPFESAEYDAARLGGRQDLVEVPSAVCDVGYVSRDLPSLAAAVRGGYPKRDPKKIGAERPAAVVLCPLAIEDQKHLVRQIFEVYLPNPEPLQAATEIIELEAVGLKGMLGRRKALISLRTACLWAW
jgi:hypothetical protein